MRYKEFSSLFRRNKPRKVEPDTRAIRRKRVGKELEFSENTSLNKVSALFSRPDHARNLLEKYIDPSGILHPDHNPPIQLDDFFKSIILDADKRLLMELEDEHYAPAPDTSSEKGLISNEILEAFLRGQRRTNSVPESYDNQYKEVSSREEDYKFHLPPLKEDKAIPRDVSSSELEDA